MQQQQQLLLGAHGSCGTRSSSTGPAVVGCVRRLVAACRQPWPLQSASFLSNTAFCKTFTLYMCMCRTATVLQIAHIDSGRRQQAKARQRQSIQARQTDTSPQQFAHDGNVRTGDSSENGQAAKELPAFNSRAASVSNKEDSDRSNHAALKPAILTSRKPIAFLCRSADQTRQLSEGRATA